MARTRLTPVELPKTHPGASVVYAAVAADIVNHNDFLLTGREVLLIENSSVGSLNVTIASAADPYGRTGDLVVAVAASTKKAIAFMDRTGWMQPDGALHLNTTAVDIKYAVLRLPA